MPDLVLSVGMPACLRVCIFYVYGCFCININVWAFGLRYNILLINALSFNVRAILPEILSRAGDYGAYNHFWRVFCQYIFMCHCFPAVGMCTYTYLPMCLYMRTMSSCKKRLRVTASSSPMGTTVAVSPPPSPPTVLLNVVTAAASVAT